VPFHFFEECLKASNRLKEALISAPILHPPIWGAPFELMCDAYEYTVAVVCGRVDRKSHIIYYVSHVLNEAKLNYTVTKKEYLVVVLSFDKFQL